MDVVDGLRALDPPVWVIAALVLVAGVLVTYDALWGVREHRAFVAAIEAAGPAGAEDVRTRFLLSWAWQPWVLTVTTLVLVAVAPGVDLGHLGLAWPDLSPLVSRLGDGFAGGGLLGAVVGLLLVAVVGALAARRRGGDAGSTTEDAAAPRADAVVSRSVEPMLPTGRRDRRAWLLLSATAGVTEEVTYRGLLLLALALLLPDAPEPILWAVAAVGFALGHAYQRWIGMAMTGVLALAFIALYAGTGSLLPGMLLHFAMDARAAFLTRAR